MNGIPTRESIAGTIENVVYRNESNDYTVLEIIAPDGELITAVGVMPMAFEGECVVLTGTWSYHKEFGKQFAFELYEKTLPVETEGILQYLSSSTVKGIGPVTALKIVNKFGIDSFDVIENHPEWLADIPGITLKKAVTISESFRQQTGIRGVMMFCKDYMGTGEVTRVYKRLGSGAVGVIKENPYILCDPDYGIPFEKADAIARSLDVPSDSRSRVLAGVIHVLAYNASSNGHTCLPIDKLISATAVLLELSEDTVSAKLDEFIRSADVAFRDVDSVRYIMTKAVYDAENFITNKLYQIDHEAPRFALDDISALLSSLESRFGIEYAALQKTAIYEALNGGVMILTGGPGTGKTTIVKALLSIFGSLKMDTVLAAPTGRAAKRMSEATSEEAKTVHRMLEMERTADNETRFGRNRQNPLDERVIIIDEASMIDIFLMEALMKAMRRGSRLILIGDCDQLPSVGAGNVFSDMIDSGVIRTVRLTEIFRQSRESLIITNAHKINNGEPPVLNVTDNDFFFVRREQERDIPSTIASLITERLPRTYGSSVRGDIQVITPSKKGVGGIDVLNAELQARINPPGKFKREKNAHGTVFREGDKVMQTANNYDIEWERGGTVGNGIFNGDIGFIETIDNAHSEMLIRFEDRAVHYSFDDLADLELAYAITVHKSQGSEYPVVIIPMYSCPPMLMTRNLLYTAVTRARRMVILVGRSDIPARMVENNREVLRYTTLKSRICFMYGS